MGWRARAADALTPANPPGQALAGEGKGARDAAFAGVPMRSSIHVFTRTSPCGFPLSRE